jgi:carbon starvation protein
VFTEFYAQVFYEEHAGRILLRAMPVLLFILGVLALAYRYYSAFLAAKVLALDDARITPAHRLNDGHNYHPTNQWVLLGHHFAAISGAGPLIGPVLAIQYGYAPGLFWLVVGVCLAGAVQDMLVLGASVRRDGKSLAEIARTELGPWASFLTSLAILFIVVIALAGLGFVVVKALGGEEVPLPTGLRIQLPADQTDRQIRSDDGGATYLFPGGCRLFPPGAAEGSLRSEAFQIHIPKRVHFAKVRPELGPARLADRPGDTVTLPPHCTQLIPGSSWGTFTIACTIPMALFVSLWMYRIRKGHVMEASLIGAAGVIAATIAGNWIPGSALEPYFSLSKETTVLALCVYGFVASVLPVWLLLCPRDYISSFLKVGTILLLVVGVLVANPTLASPAINETFLHGGPTFRGSVFPFVFICIMCGAISGFHALVASGTTPKMVDKESHIRPIGYGSMLMEGLVGVVALISAAALDPKLYYEINVPVDQEARFQQPLAELYQTLGLMPEARDRMHQVGVDGVQHLDLARVEEMVGGESLRGRTGGAVTLAVSMALIFTQALAWTGWHVAAIMKYWYHFAIMFEALFILTTIDTGTRIARFLMQEMLGRFHAPFGKTDWPPGAILSTALVTAGWGTLVYTGSIDTIWPMFGIANQLLAVLALALVTTLLINGGKGRYAWVTLLPMLFVSITTLTAGTQLVAFQFPTMINTGLELKQSGLVGKGTLSLIMALLVMVLVSALVFMAVIRWLAAAVESRRMGAPPQR